MTPNPFTSSAMRATSPSAMQFDDEGRERVVSYQSRQMKPGERNFPVQWNFSRCATL
ncbi:hypothetical protein PC128_g27596 [Phytophthora cactorum]|nr:hypothetical protein PC120_g15765 [Phytophthora cactorum]KAG3123693.1 hypothetical protein PC128_g27596 [Phytophthora cactorum]KAG4048569.1 hypothetical protein PC123_g16130 [Phytophthora cactorum]